MFLLLLCLHTAASTSSVTRNTPRHSSNVTPGHSSNVLDELTVIKNPGCVNETLCKDANLLHVQYGNQHFLWSTDRGLTGLSVLSDSNISLVVDWDKYSEGGAISLSPQVSNIGWSLKSLYLANSTTRGPLIDLTVLAWDNVTFVREGDTVRANFSTTDRLINIQIWYDIGPAGRTTFAPFLKYNVNMSVYDVHIDLLQLHPTLKVVDPSKAYLNLLVGSTETLTVNVTQTFDDEYSPALFQYNLISQLRTDKDSPPNYNRERGYLQWRPVLYTSPDREILASLTFNDSKLYKVSTAPVNLLRQYYPLSSLRMVTLKMLPPDGRTKLSDSAYWSGVLGHGEPQTEIISGPATVLTLCIIGIPCLAVLVLGLALVCRRSTPVGHDYAPI